MRTISITIARTAPPNARIACSSCGEPVCEYVLRYRGRYVALCHGCQDAVRTENAAFRAAGGTFDAWIERLDEIEARYTWYVEAAPIEQMSLF